MIYDVLYQYDKKDISVFKKNQSLFNKAVLVQNAVSIPDQSPIDLKELETPDSYEIKVDNKVIYAGQLYLDRYYHDLKNATYLLWFADYINPELNSYVTESEFNTFKNTIDSDISKKISSELSGSLAATVATEVTKQTPKVVQPFLTTINDNLLFTASYVLTDDNALKRPTMFPEWSADSIKYYINYRTRYKGLLYKCLQDHTSQLSWAPDVTPSLWVRIDDPAVEWPEWRQPTGSTDAYPKGAKVTHNGKKWISNIDANVWEPGVDGSNWIVQE